ncbi:MAG: hypothetical protein MMC33_001450 [Icmadophila ericetorum]|nr:hypothetical protein [Icmadophila ericetorum]
MGGLISAEVVLKPPSPPSEEPLRHHILGTISFDTPFLGMHPGVIVSGISSLFKPPPPMNTKPHAVAAAENKSLHSLVPSPLLMPTGRDKSKLPGREAIPSERREVPDSSDSGYFNQEPVALDYTSHMLATEASISQLSLATPGEGEAANDPNFNPPFENDVRLSNRKGWANFFHFVSKHSDNLFKVTKEYVGSHMEFGSAMADYEGLKSRYLKIRALEDIDDFAPLSPSESGNPQKKLRRVRFVNYYTASTGRLQPPKSKFSMGNIEPRPAFDGASSSVEEGVENMSLSTDSSRISFSVQSEEGGAKPLDVVKETGESSGSSDDEFCEIGPSQFDGIRESSPDMKELEPTPELDPETTPASDHEDIAGQQNEDGNAEVEEAAVPTDPPTIEEDGSKSGDIPAMPTRPEPFDASLYSDEVNRKAAEKEYTRQTKVFEKALKERNNAIKEQAKLKEKREKSARQAREKQVKQEEKIRVKEEKEEMKKQAKQEKKEMKAKVPKNADPASIAMATAAATSAHVDPTKHPDGVMPEGDKSDEHQEKHKRDRRFCVIPHRNADGKRPCWERVYMVGVDEVGAHCGLFFADRPHYEHLISDVGERIKDWVQHAASVREIGKLQSDGPLDVD